MPAILDDPALRLLAASLDDLEQVRMATAGRLRALTDPDLYGLTAANPIVARTAAMLTTLEAAEHDAELAMARRLRTHPLWPALAHLQGLGQRQVGRLLGVLGDPYWNDLHDRPRSFGELVAYCGLHVLPAGNASPATQAGPAGGATLPAVNEMLAANVPDGGRTQLPAAKTPCAANVAPGSGTKQPADHGETAAHLVNVGGPQQQPAGQSTADPNGRYAGGPELPDAKCPNGTTGSLGAGTDPAPKPDSTPSISTVGIGQTGGDPGNTPVDTQPTHAGVAPARRRGHKANWNADARMRLWNIAGSCVKQKPGTPFRDVYDHARAKYTDAVHQVPCLRCGPAGKPAAAGSPLSLAHQHARAMRLVMRAVLRECWIQARAIHQEQEATDA